MDKIIKYGWYHAYVDEKWTRVDNPFTFGWVIGIYCLTNIVFMIVAYVVMNEQQTLLGAMDILVLIFVV